MKFIGILVLLYGVYGIALLISNGVPKVWELGHFMAHSMISVLVGVSVIASDIKAKSDVYSYFRGACWLNLFLYLVISFLLHMGSFMARF